MRKKIGKNNSGTRDPGSLCAAILRNTATGIHIYHLEDRSDPRSLRMIEVNPAGARLVKMTRRDMVGRLILDIFPGLEKAGLHKKYREVALKGRPLRVSDFLYGQAKLEPSWYSFNAFSLPGDCVGVLFENVSRAKNAELSLAGAKARLENIINTVGSPIFVKDRKHKWILLNDAYCRFMGYPRRRLIGRSDYDFFPKAQADVFWKKDEAVFRSGRENINEEKFTDSSGTEHTIVTTKRRYVDASGKQVLVGVINDITDIRRADRQLSMFRKLLERSTDGLFIVDPSTASFLDVNETACRRLGYSRKEILKLKVYDIMANGSRDAWEKLASRVLKDGFFSFTAEDRKKDGTTFPVEANVNAARYDGRWYFLAVVRDISERRKMEEAIKEVKTLQDLIPICANCKKIRDDKGYWEQVETYFEKNSDAKFTHGLCEACTAKLYGHEDWYKDMKHR